MGRLWMALGGSVMERAGAGENDGEAAGAGADRKASWRAVGGAEGGGARVDAGGVDWMAAGREGTPAFGMTMGREDGDTDRALGSVRGTGVLRNSGGREGVKPVVTAGVVVGVGVGVDGVVEIFGATADGTLLLGRVAGGRVCVNCSLAMPAGTGAGRLGDVEGVRPFAGMLGGRLGFSEPPPDGTVSGRALGVAMPMRSTEPPDEDGGAMRETSGRLSTDSGGRAAWTGTVGRYTATSAGRPPDGLGREVAKAWAAAGLFTSRSSVRLISSRLCRWTSSRVIPLLMITVLLLPRILTPWPLATWTLLSRTKRSACWRGNRWWYRWGSQKRSQVVAYQAVVPMPNPMLTALFPFTQEKPTLAFQRHSGGSGAHPQ